MPEQKLVAARTTTIESNPSPSVVERTVVEAEVGARARKGDRQTAAAPTRAPHVQIASKWPEPFKYEGATCSGVFVYAVTLSESAPRSSAASLATSSAGSGKYVRPGQKLEDWEVLSITDDWTGSNPIVWLVRGDQVCRARLTGNPERARAVQREAEAQAEAQRQRRRRRRRRRR